MQLLFAPLLVTLLALPGQGWAQTKINTQFDKTTLKTAFRTLKEISGVNFVYNNQQVNDQTIISASILDKSLEEALALVLAQTPYRFDKMKDYILITIPKNDPQVPSKTITVRFSMNRANPCQA